MTDVTLTSFDFAVLFYESQKKQSRTGLSFKRTIPSPGFVANIFNALDVAEVSESCPPTAFPQAQALAKSQGRTGLKLSQNGLKNSYVDPKWPKLDRVSIALCKLGVLLLLPWMGY